MSTTKGLHFGPLKPLHCTVLLQNVRQFSQTLKSKDSGRFIANRGPDALDGKCSAFEGTPSSMGESVWPTARKRCSDMNNHE